MILSMGQTISVSIGIFILGMLTMSTMEDILQKIRYKKSKEIEQSRKMTQLSREISHLVDLNARLRHKLEILEKKVKDQEPIKLTPEEIEEKQAVLTDILSDFERGKINWTEARHQIKAEIG